MVRCLIAALGPLLHLLDDFHGADFDQVLFEVTFDLNLQRRCFVRRFEQCQGLFVSRLVKGVELAVGNDSKTIVLAAQDVSRRRPGSGGPFFEHSSAQGRARSNDLGLIQVTLWSDALASSPTIPGPQCPSARIPVFASPWASRPIEQSTPSKKKVASFLIVHLIHQVSTLRAVRPGNPITSRSLG